MNSTERRVITVIMQQLRINGDEITPDASIAHDLGADSLDAIEIIMALEDEFGLEIPDEDAERITTVQQAIDYVARVLTKPR